MAKVQGRSFKYGMPIYGLSWPEGDTIYISGGGGMGIKNRLVCANVISGQLTDQVAEFHFGDNCPMRLAVTPNNKSIVFAMGQGGIKRLDLDARGKVPKFTEMTGDLQERLSEVKGEVKCFSFRPGSSHLAIGFDSGELHVYEWPSMKPKFSLSGDKKLADAIRDIDFSLLSGADAAAAAAGGAQAAHASSRGSHLIAVTLDNGTCEVWDWERNRQMFRMEPGKLKQKLERTILLSSEGKTSVQRLPSGTERVQISKLRFARDGTGDLLTLLNTPQSGGHIARWGGIAALQRPAASGAAADAATTAPEPSSPAAGLPTLVACKKVSDHPCTCFDVSRDGELLACGTSMGGVVVATANASTTLVRKLLNAHMVFATGIAFSHNCKHVVSVSADASARITDISKASVRAAYQREGRKVPEWARHMQGVIILLAIILVCGLQAFRVMKDRGMSNQEIEAMVMGWFGRKDEL